MKYGLLTGFLTPFFNYGDFAQSIAIEHLYRHMGIPETEILHLTLEELPSYGGDPLLLPFNSFFSLLMDRETGDIRISDKIKPVFLGMTVADAQYARPLEEVLTEKAVRYLRQYAPIGCRDAFTRDILERYEIPCYLQGCLTNIFPKRKPNGAYKKVFLVDCPREALPFIPKQLLQNAEILENSGYVGDKSPEEVWEHAKQHYAYFRDQGALVISSRYHAVTPCYAMGIPSIFLKRTHDQQLQDARLDTLNPHIPLYSEKEYADIDWNPPYREMEDLKRVWMDLAAARIRDARVCYSGEKALAAFWEPSLQRYRNKAPSFESLHQVSLQGFVARHFAKPRKGRFYIWGAKPCFCQNGKVSLVKVIQAVNPDLRFSGWIDTYKKGVLAGNPIYTPGERTLGREEFLVLASEAAIPDAKRFLQANGIGEDRFVICVNQFITQQDLDWEGEPS